MSKKQQDLALKPYLHPAKTGKRSRNVINPPSDVDVDRQMQKQLEIGSNKRFFDWVVATAYNEEDGDKQTWTRVTGDDLIQQGAPEMAFDYNYVSMCNTTHFW